jgi:dTMP kinase
MRNSNSLIVFEGIDGAGKATQVGMLQRRLAKASRRPVFVFSSPRYETPTGKLVKAALHGEYGNFVALSPYLSALPYLLDFAAMRDEIVRALEKGIVICDRYVPSTLAFHSAKLPPGTRKVFIDFVERLMYRDLKLPRPTRVIYLDVPPKAAGILIKNKKQDQHEKDRSYQKRVAETYKQLARRKEWRTIPCTADEMMRSKEEIHELVWKAVQ